MITTNKEINLSQLDHELGGYGLVMNDNDPDNKIIKLADESPLTYEQLQKGIDKHNAIFPVMTIEEKLSFVGLNLDDLKAALGL